MLHRHDNDRDGMIDAFELRAAIKDTILACATDTSSSSSLSSSSGPLSASHGGGSSSATAHAVRARAAAAAAQAGSGTGVSTIEHPLAMSDSDSDAVFTAVALKFTPRSLDTPRPLIPLEAFHSALRGSLTPSRRANLVSIFSGLDKEGTGAVPIPVMMVAFRAEGHPSVTAGRGPSVTALYKQFADSFGEGFSYQDKFGRANRLRAGPAGEAYTGLGDGCVRLPFFEAWHEGLAATLDDGPDGDAEFNLVSFNIWSGGGSGAGSGVGGVGGRSKGRGGTGGGPTAVSNFDAATMAAKIDDGEAGLISSMAKLGMSRGANASSTAPAAATFVSSPARGRAVVPVAVEREGFSKSMTGLLPGPASQHPSYAAPGPFGGGVCAASGAQSSSASSAVGGAGGMAPPPPSSSSPSRFGYGRRALEYNSDGYGAGGISGASSLDGSRRGSVAPPSYSQQSAYPSAAASAAGGAANVDPEYATILNSIRSVLLTRGPKAGFKLIRSLEQAAAASAGSYQYQQQAGPPLSRPMPSHVFMTVLRDNSLGIGPRQCEGVLQRLERSYNTSSSSGGGGGGYGSGGMVISSHFTETLFNNPGMSTGRQVVVRQAYDHVCRKAQTSGGSTGDDVVQVLLPGVGAAVVPSLDYLRMAYSSSHHPEVRAGKRSEDEVLREFFETFDGPSFTTASTSINPANGSAVLGVTQSNFASYYSVLSFFLAEDAHFTTLLFDTWALWAVGECSAQCIRKRRLLVLLLLLDCRLTVVVPFSRSLPLLLFDAGAPAPAADAPAAGRAMNGGGTYTYGQQQHAPQNQFGHQQHPMAPTGASGSSARLGWGVERMGWQ